ncbi:hypothetical protein EON65_42885 [archaeon]|nr:MAG: hypothetical protein EON65_42885 [archaeon]
MAEGEAKEKAKIAAQQRVIEEVKVVRQNQRDEARNIREEIKRKNYEVNANTVHHSIIIRSPYTIAAYSIHQTPCTIPHTSYTATHITPLSK